MFAQCHLHCAIRNRNALAVLGEACTFAGDVVDVRAGSLLHHINQAKGRKDTVTQVEQKLGKEDYFILEGSPDKG